MRCEPALPIFARCGQSARIVCDYTCHCANWMRILLICFRQSANLPPPPPPPPPPSSFQPPSSCSVWLTGSLAGWLRHLHPKTLIMVVVVCRSSSVIVYLLTSFRIYLGILLDSLWHRCGCKMNTK